MQQIAIFLEQFKTIGLQTILLKEAVMESVRTHVGITLEKKDISLKDNVIYIDLPPSGKSELFMKREKIAQDIVDKIGRPKAPTIK